jgi:hypothetical protein
MGTATCVAVAGVPFVQPRAVGLEVGHGGTRNRQLEPTVQERA